MKYETPFEFMRYLSFLTKIITLKRIPPLGERYDFVVVLIAMAVNQMSKTFADYNNFFQKDLMITELELQSIIR